MRNAMSKGRFTELRQRIFFVIGAMLVFRIGSFITVPGIDPATLAQMFEQQRGTILEMFNMFSGGALSRLSLFALGIMPYISASIIMQLLTKVHPKLEQLNKEGAAGRRKITQYTRFFTLALAIFQALGISVALSRQPGLVIIDQNTFYFTTVVTLVTGTMFLMW
ncbi:MAG: preprotein translocase subunit SecY, partial [Thioalkalispiraceae bacterium]